MTATLSCEALRDDIIALLYDDGDVAERSRARDHLAGCVPCRSEYSELRGVRNVLGGWSLPLETPLPKPRALQTRANLRWFSAGLAAAAGLVLGIGLAAAGRSILFPDTVVGPRSLAANQPAATARPVALSYDELQELLKAQESRHEAEIADLRRSLIRASETSAPVAGALSKVSAELSPATFERLLRASEERQARLFEARLAGLRTESDLQRQYDMAQIAAGLAYIDSRTGAEAARTSELMKNLVRVTAKPPDR